MKYREVKGFVQITQLIKGRVRTGIGFSKSIPLLYLSYLITWNQERTYVGIISISYT